MNAQERAIIEAAEPAVERAVKTFSRQPRFSGSQYDTIFGAMMRWMKLAADLQIPPYSADSRRRDKWLQEFWPREPHWGSVINQLCTINASRGYSLVGGRNQVNRYRAIIQNAEDGAGWRTFLKMQSQAFYTTDMNTVCETARTGENGPLAALYHVDSTECRLTGNPEYPLKYYPASGRMQKWGPFDFFRVSANPSQQAKFNRLGLCATSMAYELIKILYGVLMHDQETVGAKMPEAIMLLSGISDAQWEDSLEKREADLDAKERRYFGGLHVLFSSGLEQLDYKLIALSNLPANFDRKIFVDQVMYAYALIVGYDAAEFWPVQFGSLGRGTEMETQHKKAATKGGLEFSLHFQEQLQRELPPTLLFEFDQRDDEGSLIEAQVSQAWADVAKTLYGSVVEGQPLLTREQALSLLVEHQIIPPEWSEIQEDEIATDVKNTEQERWLSAPEVQRALTTFPNEPIIRYNSLTGRETVLFDPHGERKTYSIPRQRQVSEVLYADPDGDFTITAEDVQSSILSHLQRVGPEFAALLVAPTMEPEGGATE